MSPDPQRDWDKELADIDKLIASGPPKPGALPSPAPSAPVPGSAPAVRAPAPVVRSRKATLGVWLRVGLGLTLGVAMTQWPYAHACGIALFLYLGAIGVVGLAGFWSALGSWRNRMGLAHVLSLLVLLWGGLLAAAVILPRVGDGSASWWCS